MAKLRMGFGLLIAAIFFEKIMYVNMKNGLVYLMLSLPQLGHMTKMSDSFHIWCRNTDTIVL